MYTTHTGYTRDLTAEMIAKNNFNACCEILSNGIDNGNLYWQRRLLAVYNELVLRGIILEKTTYEQWKSAESDYAKCKKSTNVKREVFLANRVAVWRWWLRVQQEYNSKTPSIYHFD